MNIFKIKITIQITVIFFIFVKICPTLPWVFINDQKNSKMEEKT